MEDAVENPQTQAPTSRPLSANAQITAGALGLITGGPLGCIAGWSALRFYKGKWIRWVLTGFLAAPVLILIQLTLLGSALKILDHSSFIPDQALEAIEGDNPQHALDLLEEYVLSHPDDPKAWYLLGLGKQKLGDYQASIEDFTKAIELKPNYFEAYISRSASEEKVKGSED